MYNQLKLDQQVAAQSPEPELSNTSHPPKEPEGHTTIKPPQPSSEPEPRDFIDPDDFLEYYSGTDFPDTPVDETTGTPDLSVPPGVSPPEKEPLSDKEAEENTEVLMDIRETVQSYGLSLYIDGTFRHAEDYEYSPEARRKLIKAWSRVIGHYRMRVSPWMGVIMAEGVTTGPMIAAVVKQKREIKELRAKVAHYEARERGTGIPHAAITRRDTKTHWKVDENGYFEYTESNTYIPKKNRKMKPELTQENYELLCKHNGREYVDSIFNIKN